MKSSIQCIQCTTNISYFIYTCIPPDDGCGITFGLLNKLFFFSRIYYTASWQWGEGTSATLAPPPNWGHVQEHVPSARLDRCRINKSIGIFFNFRIAYCKSGSRSSRPDNQCLRSNENAMQGTRSHITLMLMYTKMAYVALSFFAHL